MIFCITTNSYSPKTSLVLSFEFKTYMLFTPANNAAALLLSSFDEDAELEGESDLESAPAVGEVIAERI